MMKTFKQFLLIEKLNKLSWIKHPDIGWWEDQNILRLYHGTNIKNFDQISKEGLTKKDPSTGMISLALEPNTAFGYASMTFGGGRVDNFRKTTGKPKVAPKEDRIIFIFDIPMKWIKQNYDSELRGNIGSMRDKIKNKEKYSPGKDIEYYATAELRFKNPIPIKFMSGYMKKP